MQVQNVLNVIVLIDFHSGVSFAGFGNSAAPQTITRNTFWNQDTTILSLRTLNNDRLSNDYGFPAASSVFPLKKSPRHLRAKNHLSSCETIIRKNTLEHGFIVKSSSQVIKYAR
jgi:actin-related protein